jgi:hypothetical protein
MILMKNAMIHKSEREREKNKLDNATTISLTKLRFGYGTNLYLIS